MRVATLSQDHTLATILAGDESAVPIGAAVKLALLATVVGGVLTQRRSVQSHQYVEALHFDSQGIGETMIFRATKETQRIEVLCKDLDIRRSVVIRRNWVILRD